MKKTIVIACLFGMIAGILTMGIVNYMPWGDGAWNNFWQVAGSALGFFGALYVVRQEIRNNDTQFQKQLAVQKQQHDEQLRKLEEQTRLERKNAFELATVERKHDQLDSIISSTVLFNQQYLEFLREVEDTPTGDDPVFPYLKYGKEISDKALHASEQIYQITTAIAQSGDDDHVEELFKLNQVVLDKANELNMKSVDLQFATSLDAFENALKEFHQCAISVGHACNALIRKVRRIQNELYNK